MNALRQTLAAPLYAMAFILHLLCAFFTWAAQYVSGDDYKPRSKLPPILIAILLVGLAVAHQARSSEEVGSSRYAVVNPMDFRGAIVNYTPQQMAWVDPFLRTQACVFASYAVRHHLAPVRVGFDACVNRDKMVATLSADLIDMTVSGVAMVEEIERQFTVTLQHYPPSTDESGFIVTAIEVR